MTGHRTALQNSTAASRFQRFKERAQNPCITISVAIMRGGHSAPALAWYMNLRAIADWSTGILPPHATPAWLEKTFGVSRRQRLTRERELRRAGLFESVQVMQKRTLRGRKRWVKVERTARVFSEPQTSQNANKNAAVFSVPLLSRLKNGTPSSLKNQNAQALKKRGAVTESVLTHRLTPNTPDDDSRSRETSQEPTPEQAYATRLEGFVKTTLAKWDNRIPREVLATEIAGIIQRSAAAIGSAAYFDRALENFLIAGPERRSQRRGRPWRNAVNSGEPIAINPARCHIYDNGGVHSGRAVTSHTHVIDNSPQVDAETRNETEVFKEMAEALRDGARGECADF